MGRIIAGVVVIVAIVWFFVFRGNEATAPSTQQQPSVKQDQKTSTMTTGQGDVKEFSMTSYFDEKGKWFSLKEIAVKKGDRVRIKVTNTKGTHDFAIDEYGIKKPTPLNEETVIEFTADKAGEFTYYCSMPGHRAGGQWGALKVTE